MDVFWLEAAIADLDEIVDYIAARNPIAAPKVAGALRAAAVRLGDQPRMGRSGRVAGTRELVVSRPFASEDDERRVAATASASGANP